MLALTFAGMAAFYVSCDTDYSQGVDAGQAKEQGEEPIHLGSTEHNWWVAVLHGQNSTTVCRIAAFSTLRIQIPLFLD